MENEISEILKSLPEIQKSIKLSKNKVWELEHQIRNLESELRKYSNLAQEISDFIGVEIEEIY